MRYAIAVPTSPTKPTPPTKPTIDSEKASASRSGNEASVTPATSSAGDSKASSANEPRQSDNTRTGARDSREIGQFERIGSAESNGIDSESRADAAEGKAVAASATSIDRGTVTEAELAERRDGKEILAEFRDEVAAEQAARSETSSTTRLTEQVAADSRQDGHQLSGALQWALILVAVTIIAAVFMSFFMRGKGDKPLRITPAPTKPGDENKNNTAVKEPSLAEITRDRRPSPQRKQSVSNPRINPKPANISPKLPPRITSQPKLSDAHNAQAQEKTSPTEVEDVSVEGRKRFEVRI